MKSMEKSKEWKRRFAYHCRLHAFRTRETSVLQHNKHVTDNDEKQTVTIGHG